MKNYFTHYNYYGIALNKEREGTNCWGHKENESCIHLKFGHPFKYYHFTPEFEKKHPDFIELYKKGFDEDAPSRETLRQIWRQIINLNEAGELVVIFNMCDLEVACPESIVFYAIQQDNRNNWTWNELTA